EGPLQPLPHLRCLLHQRRCCRRQPLHRPSLCRKLRRHQRQARPPLLPRSYPV
ncbi:hypothetical protein HK405_012588, partial [Cladochytrium tenue]